jgi:hypothetical protein
MNNLPRQELQRLIQQYGHSLCHDPVRIKGLLRDTCGQYRREVSGLLSALQEDVPNHLLTTSQSGTPLSVTLPRLTKQLQDHVGLDEETARWSVESWALALNLNPQPELTGVSSQPSHKGNAPIAPPSATAPSPVNPQSLNPQDSDPQTTLEQKRLKLKTTFKDGTNWFYWIAGLSIVNSIGSLMGASINFVIGLGVTQAIDEIAKEGRGSASSIGFIFNLLIAGFFIMMGKLGQKRRKWAVVLGIVIYLLDTLLFVAINDWLGVAFHALALIWLWQGFRAMNDLIALEKTRQ